jgi:hypothetical protein
MAMFVIFLGMEKDLENALPLFEKEEREYICSRLSRRTWWTNATFKDVGAAAEAFS